MIFKGNLIKESPRIARELTLHNSETFKKAVNTIVQNRPMLDPEQSGCKT